jgi:membrane-associated phospholipid phosphatase
VENAYGPLVDSGRLVVEAVTPGTLAYLLYLLVLAWTRALPTGRRRVVTIVALADAAWLAWLATRQGPGWDVVRDWQPLVQVLLGYWLSGAFFVRPMPAAEAWLARGDRWLFERAGLAALVDRSPRVILELLELAYLSVYFVLPLGFATALWLAPDVDTGRYWRVVMAAELGCYGVLPWVQTRTPRALGDHLNIERRPLAIRQLNSLVLRHGSIQVNTFPSGHAAGSVATALAVAAVSPAAGVIFGVIAAGIVIGSVVGRYHYAADSLAGVLVAVAAWLVLG